jgi:hypothetical protein
LSFYHSKYFIQDSLLAIFGRILLFKISLEYSIYHGNEERKQKAEKEDINSFGYQLTAVTAHSSKLSRYDMTEVSKAAETVARMSSLKVKMSLKFLFCDKKMRANLSGILPTCSSSRKSF